MCSLSYVKVKKKSSFERTVVTTRAGRGGIEGCWIMVSKHRQIDRISSDVPEHSEVFIIHNNLYIYEELEEKSFRAPNIKKQ